MLKNKKILIGISGGIAAYKSLFLIRLFIKQGAKVKVVVTGNALHFVTPLSIETLSGNKIYADMFQDHAEYTTEHIALTDWADIFIVAPATANIIGKYANGIADDALSTSLLAFSKQVFIAPSMNTKMYNNPAVIKNIQILRSYGVKIIEAPEGDLACGYEGAGRMEEPENILKKVLDYFKQSASFAGKKVLVTAGGTKEAIDAVRFIGNHASGLMGFSIAREFANRGAKVTLITAPSGIKISDDNIRRIDVVSADEMHMACQKEFPKTDITVMAAAVADYAPLNPRKNKIKKNPDNSVIHVSLKPTTDILAGLGKIKKKNQLLIGFALETDNEIENAYQKLFNKNLDLIILNSLKDKGAGFGTATNKITIIDKHKNITPFQLKSKSDVAADIANKIEQLIVK